MSNLNSKKPYNPALCNVDEFYIPHAEANHLNAQDVIHSLVTQAKTLATIGVCQYEQEDKQTVCKMNNEHMQNLLWDIQTKLDMINKILPTAFDYKGPVHEQA